MPSLPALRAATAISPLVNPSVTQGLESTSAIMLWWKLGISMSLVVTGGVFAGLTLGLMGLDELHIRVLSVSSPDEKERADARTVLNLLKRGRHWVLVTLLLSNVVINESLPVFLDSAIGGGVAAVAISTTMIVIFGEVIPQALCARYGMSIGARCAAFVTVLMWILAPVAYPIAKLLDYVLGVEGEHTYKKSELRAFLHFHLDGKEPLRQDEVAIIDGVLSLSDKRVTSIMTPLKDVYVLSEDDVLDQVSVKRLMNSGFFRFPVHESGAPNSFIGCLSLNELLAYDPSRNKRVSDFVLSILPEAPGTLDCLQALNYFQTYSAHVLMILDASRVQGGAIGVVSLEDVVHEILAVDGTVAFEASYFKQIAERIRGSTTPRGDKPRHSLNIPRNMPMPRPLEEITSILLAGGPDMNYNTMKQVEPLLVV